jgi:hypothetical protein
MPTVFSGLIQSNFVVCGPASIIQSDFGGEELGSGSDHPFDLLQFDGKNLRNLPIKERKARRSSNELF